MKVLDLSYIQFKIVANNTQDAADIQFIIQAQLEKIKTSC